MHGDTLVEIGPHLLPKLATDSQQTIPQSRCDNSTLAQGAGQHEETPKVSCVYQDRANPSHTDDAWCKPRSPRVPHTNAEEVLGAQGLWLHSKMYRALFAFCLCHCPVTVLLHPLVTSASFPHTPSRWKSPLASSFRVNTEGKHYETPPWKTRPLNFLQKANGTQAAATLHTPASHGGWSRSSLPVHRGTKRKKEE